VPRSIWLLHSATTADRPHDYFSGTDYVSSSWSDGKAQQHDLVTGATPSAHTATFGARTMIDTPGADVALRHGWQRPLRGLGATTLRGRGYAVVGADTEERHFTRRALLASG
jgi:hypothetical protein